MSHAQDQTDRPFPPGMQLRFTLVYLALFLPFGIATPYLQIQLKASGLDGVGIGLTQGTLDLMGVIAPPLWGLMADRWRRPRTMLLLAVLGSLASFWLFSVTGSPLPAMAVAAAFGLCYRPLIPMTDGITFAFTRTRGGDYGLVRWGGSVAFMAAAILLGWLGAGKVAGAHWIAPLMSLALIIHGAALWLLPSDRDTTAPAGPASAPAPESETDYTPPSPDELPDPGMVSGPMLEPLPDTEEPFHPPVVRSRRFEAEQRPDHPEPDPGDDRPAWLALLAPGFVAFCLAALLGRLAMMSYYQFYSLFLEARFPSAPTGILWAIGPLSEIPIIFFSLAIMKRVGVRNLFIIGLVGVILRLLGFCVISAQWQLYPLQLLHALTFGAVHAASVTYVSRLVPVSLQNTAQTVFAGFTMGLGGILGGALGGWVMERFGFAVLYGAFAGIATAGLILTVLVVPNDRRAGA